MKRRDFLKVLGITATTPVLGQVVVPTPVAPPIPVEPVEVVFPSVDADWGEVETVEIIYPTTDIEGAK